MRTCDKEENERLYTIFFSALRSRAHLLQPGLEVLQVGLVGGELGPEGGRVREALMDGDERHGGWLRRRRRDGLLSHQSPRLARRA